jgi:orotidine-5'-phosphate decarboxylase
MESRIIVALKVMSPGEALKWAKLLSGKVWGFKLNTMLFQGMELINDLKEFGHVMADAKVFEIPDDMDNSVRFLLNAGADFVTVHMAADWQPPADLADKVAGVTVLTSFDDAKCARVFGHNKSIFQVEDFVSRAIDLRYKKIVCSAADLRNESINTMIKNAKIAAICPSIRMEGSVVKGDDQVRKATPCEAVKLGTRFLVVGRPIFQASDPIAVVDTINYEVDKGLYGCNCSREPHGN